jgi:NTE family protein
MALGMDADEMMRVLPPLMRYAFFNPTLPIFSLMSGEKFLRGVDKMSGGYHLEDFLLPVFAVSTSLTRGTPVVHRRGSVTHAMRATSAIPRIFPPIAIDGDILIDGGLSTNVPVEAMHDLFAGSILGVDVMPEIDVVAEGEFPPAVSGFQ